MIRLAVRDGQFIRNIQPAQVPQSKTKEEAAAAVSGAYKDDDSKYSLKNLLKRQETEAGHEE